MDFGAWTGAAVDDLAGQPAWERFNQCRSFADVPCGERALDVQARIVRALGDMRVRHPNQTVALVSHADVIRLLVLHIAGARVDFIGLHDAGATRLYVSLLDGG